MLLYLGFDARQSIMTIPLELKYFTPPIESRDMINILPTSFFSVHTVSQGILFFMARAPSAWAINSNEKSSVRNLRYGPRTRLVRGIFLRVNNVFQVLQYFDEDQTEREDLVNKRWHNIVLSNTESGEQFLGYRKQNIVKEPFNTGGR